MKALERSLGLGGVFGLSVSAMLGPGAFIVPGVAIHGAGGLAWLTYIVAALIILPTAFAKSELASAMPRSGGAYVFITQAFGPAAGSVMGTGLWLSLVLKSAFALVGLGAYLSLVSDLDLRMVAIGMLAIMTALNLRGIDKVSKAQSAIVWFSVVALSVLLGVSIPEADPQKLEPLAPTGVAGFFETVALVFVAYAGVTKVAAIAGEVQNPGRNLPRGILWAMGFITPLYATIVLMMLLTVDRAGLDNSLTPVHSMTEVLMGDVAAKVAVVLGVLVMFAMANAGLLTASRFPFAMSKDGLLPHSFAELGSKGSTPVRCILLTSGAMTCAVLFIDVEGIIKLASAFQIISFGANNLSVLLLRESKPQWYRPAYKSPFFPAIQIFGVVAALGLLFALGFVALAAAIAVLVLGGGIWLFYGKNHVKLQGVLSKFSPRSDLQAEIAKTEVATVLPTEATSFVALLGRATSVETLTQMGAAFARGKAVEVVHVSEVDNQVALDEVLEEEPYVGSIRRRVLGMREMTETKVKFDPIVSHDVVASIHRLSTELHCRWLLMAWRPFRLFNPLGWLLNHLPCDLIVFKDAGIRYIRKVLVVVDDESDDALLSQATTDLSRYFRARVTFARFAPKNASSSELHDIADHVDHLRRMSPVGSDVLVLKGESHFEAVVAATEEFDLMLMSSYARKGWRNQFFKSEQDKIASASLCSVLMIRTPQERLNPVFEPERFRLFSHIEEAVIGVKVAASTKESLFELCASQFSSSCKDYPVDSIIEAMQIREEAQNTGVGNGVAMPHGTLPQLERTHLLIATLDSEVDYGTMDDVGVRVVFATISPPDDRATVRYLNTALARLAVQTSFLDKLHEATDSKDIVAALHESLQE